MVSYPFVRFYKGNISQQFWVNRFQQQVGASPTMGQSCVNTVYRTPLCNTSLVGIYFSIFFGVACSRIWILEKNIELGGRKSGVYCTRPRRVWLKKKAKWGNQGFPSPLTYRLTSRYVLDPEETTLVQVGGWPTPLKNINIRQLGRFSISNMMGKSFKIHVPVTTKQIGSSPYALFFCVPWRSYFWPPHSHMGI